MSTKIGQSMKQDVLNLRQYEYKRRTQPPRYLDMTLTDLKRIGSGIQFPR